MPRPKKSNETVRPHVVSFRLTEAEQAQLDDEAAAAGLTANECARIKAVGPGKVKRQSPAMPVPDVSFGLRQELRRIGVNMNQIARQLNMTGEHDPVELRDASRHLDEIFARLFTGAVNR